MAHEIRHCYQEYRAECCETQEDIEFRKSLSEKMDPDLNYQEYEDSLVERDAREYGAEIRRKLQDIENGTREIPADANGTQDKEFEAKTVDAKDLPEDLRHKFERNDADENLKETDRFHETLEAEELERLKEQVTPYYENGRELAKNCEIFDNYKEHCMIEGGHIGKVHDKSLEAADQLENLFEKNSYNGYYSSNIDRKSLEVMALYHDTGMDGNIPAENYQARLDEYLKEHPEKSPEKNKKDFDLSIRKQHPLQSAIHVLKDREAVEALGGDADKVAFGVLMHSKSNSGIENLADNEQWEDALSKLRHEVEEYNKKVPENERIVFNDDFLRDQEGKFDSEKQAQMRSEALCLRVGDANGHDSRSRISQNGKRTDFALEDWKLEELPKDLKDAIAKGDYAQFKKEAGYTHVEVDGVETTDENDEDGFGRAFAVGEGNFRTMSMETDEDGPVEKIVLEDGDAYPLCTQFCIVERLKEFNTAKIEKDIEITRPEGMNDKEFKEYQFQQRARLMDKINFTAVIDIGNAEEEAKTSYKKFADRIFREYKIHVKIVPE